MVTVTPRYRLGSDPMIKRPKTRYIKTLFDITFLPPFRSVLYSRAVSRWPYQHSQTQMNLLRELLLSVTSAGAYLEVGCAEGWTTIWLGTAMRETGMTRPMAVIDTFAGFTEQDKMAETDRGKIPGTYDSFFVVNRKRWFDESMRRAGCVVTSHQSDCSTFDYASLGPIAFALIDVDLYRPVTMALHRLFACMAHGGIIVVDDCDPNDTLWDGASHAYMECCKEHGSTPEVLGSKFGILRF